MSRSVTRSTVVGVPFDLNNPIGALLTKRHGEPFGQPLAAHQAASTPTLSVLEGGEVVYLSYRNSSAPLGISFRAGMRLPAVFAATGKAMLAAGAGEEVLLRPLPAPLTPRSAKTVETLQDQLSETAERGYSIDRGEVREGMVSLGAAILNGTGKPIAGIAMSMTEAEAKEESVVRLGCLIASLAGALSKGLGPVAD